tara:strand:- start:19625 stop:20230 length:606 start_codon:yes stop_codon:yes gene_type:complete
MLKLPLNYKIGDLAEKYEVSNRGPGYISSGASWGDPGGDSYGSYQLETKKGTMQEYLQGDDRFINTLKKFKVNSLEFRAKWRQLAAEDEAGFEQSQFMYLSKKKRGAVEALRYADQLGWSANNFALQSAVFSTVNQSGGWRKGIFDKAGIKATDDIKTQINKLYDARAAYFRSLTTLTPEIKRNIIQQRTVLERKDCLKLV